MTLNPASYFLDPWSGYNRVLVVVDGEPRLADLSDAFGMPWREGLVVLLRRRPAYVPTPLEDLHLPTSEDMITVIDRSIRTGHRLAIEVRVASRGGELRRYVVEPITLRLNGGDAYLHAWSVERDALRTFKVARITAAEVLGEHAEPHSDVDVAQVFQAAVKTWSGDIVRVRIRMASEIAWTLPEYPLVAGQTVQEEPDGSVVVEADVAGLVEASRWVLGWGRHAEVLAPEALRDLVLAELDGALARYRGRSPMVSDPGVSGPRIGDEATPRSTTRTSQVRARGHGG